MKKTLITLSLLFVYFIGFSQMTPIKRFDYSLLENKTLYIPTYKANEAFIKRMKRRGKFDKITDLKAKVAHYNKSWEEAMAESSYDATDYEIRGFDRRTLIKNKNSKAIIMVFTVDDYGNRMVSMIATGPKRRVIARAYINKFDLSEKNDIRLMMNMLNDALTVASEVESGEEKKSRKAVRSKYKQRLVDFYADIKTKTFLVPKSTHKKPKKAASRNADLKNSLKTWKLSKYEFTTEEAIEERRLNGDTESYYWKDIPFYSNVNGVPLTYHMNYILSTDGDNIITVFLGKKRLKPATLEKIQKKIVSKATRYKDQLAK